MSRIAAAFGLLLVAGCGNSQPQSVRASDGKPIVAAIKAHLGDRVELSDDVRLKTALSDLNGDGRDEAIVYIIDPQMCGSGGCNTYILTPDQAGGYRAIGNITITHLPIYRLPTKHLGWNDLGVTVRNDYVEGGFVAVPFTGNRYALNPTVPPARPASPDGATLLIDREH